MGAFFRDESSIVACLALGLLGAACTALLSSGRCGSCGSTRFNSVCWPHLAPHAGGGWRGAQRDGCQAGAPWHVPRAVHGAHLLPQFPQCCAWMSCSVDKLPMVHDRPPCVHEHKAVPTPPPQVWGSMLGVAGAAALVALMGEAAGPEATLQVQAEGARS